MVLTAAALLLTAPLTLHSGWGQRQTSSLHGLLLAEAEGTDTIKTKDGVVHTGQILSETHEGYLFREAEGSTSVIPFSSIDDLQRANARLVPVTSASPMTPVVDRQKSDRLFQLHLELRDLEARLDRKSFWNPLGEVISSAAGVALVLLLPVGPPMGWILLGLSGVTGLVGVVQLVSTAVERGQINREISRVRGQLTDLGEMQSAEPPLPGIVIARF